MIGPRFGLGGIDDSGGNATCEELASLAIGMGLRRIQMVAWRDLDDPEAGGSELHSHKIASRWAAAGLDVSFRTSAVPAQPIVVERSGYRSVRRNGRYSVFPVVAWEGIHAAGKADAVVEIWNGMPFFSPLWFHGPSVVFLHHVHAEMWRMALPPSLAALGRRTESTIAPLLYRRSRIVTLSRSSRDEIVSMLGIPEHRVTVVPPGVDPRFTPGGERSEVPLVVAVGRLVPVKRFEVLIESLARAREMFPELEAVIIGEGYERDRLEALRHQVGADRWLHMPGRLSDDEVKAWYRRAWVVAATSLREGWGMTLTEAAACGTPAVATRIAGHLDAVIDETTGLLADGVENLVDAFKRVLGDESLRRRLGRSAERYARSFTWDATASSTLRALLGEETGRA
jgi:glycosyltransferase involved in cell wall biosynthesis